MSADYTVIESVRQQFGDEKHGPDEMPLQWLERALNSPGRRRTSPFPRQTSMALILQSSSSS